MAATIEMLLKVVQFTLLHCYGQGWGPRGLPSTSRTPRVQNFVALALALASTMRGLDFGFKIWP